MKAITWLVTILTFCLFASFAVVACDDGDDDNGDDDDNDDDDDNGGDDDVFDDQCAWKGYGYRDENLNSNLEDSEIDPNSFAYREYNADGLLLKDSFYYGEEGWGACDYYSYNGSNQHVRVYEDYECDGVNEYCALYFYNGDQLARWEVYQGECEPQNLFECALWEYWTENKRAHFYDGDCDGIKDENRCVVQILDDSGRVVESYEQSGECSYDNESREECNFSTYDSKGLLIKSSGNSLCDGDLDTQSIYLNEPAE